MRKALGLLALAGSVTLITNGGHGQEDVAHVPPPAEPGRMEVIKLEHAPAGEVAATLSQMLSNVRVVPYSVSNELLFVNASGDQLQKLREIVTTLDRKPAAVEMDVMILQTSGDDEIATSDLVGDAAALEAKINALTEAGTVQILERLHLTTADNQRSQLHFGGIEPVTRGRTFSPQPGRGGFDRGSQPIVSMEAAGTKLTMLPRVSAGDLIAELALEKSWIPKTPEDANEDDVQIADATQTISVQSTVTIPKGQAVYLGGQTVQSNGKKTRIAIIVTAKMTR